jgi:hypothetical protein
MAVEVMGFVVSSSNDCVVYSVRVGLDPHGDDRFERWTAVGAPCMVGEEQIPFAFWCRQQVLHHHYSYTRMEDNLVTLALVGSQGRNSSPRITICNNSSHTCVTHLRDICDNAESILSTRT